MNPNRIAGIGAAAVLALFAVGGTAMAASNALGPDSAATPIPVAQPTFAAAETTTPPAPAPGEPIGPDGAEAAALAAVGGGRVTELEADREDGGRVEWEVEVTDGATVHELRIDGITGEVLQQEIDGSDRDDDLGDRDDDRDDD